MQRIIGIFNISLNSAKSLIGDLGAKRLSGINNIYCLGKSTLKRTISNAYTTRNTMLKHGAFFFSSSHHLITTLPHFLLFILPFRLFFSFSSFFPFNFTNFQLSTLHLHSSLSTSSSLIFPLFLTIFKVWKN